MYLNLFLIRHYIQIILSFFTSIIAKPAFRITYICMSHFFCSPNIISLFRQGFSPYYWCFGAFYILSLIFFGIFMLDLMFFSVFYYPLNMPTFLSVPLLNVSSTIFHKLLSMLSLFYIFLWILLKKNSLNFSKILSTSQTETIIS